MTEALICVCKDIGTAVTISFTYVAVMRFVIYVLAIRDGRKWLKHRGLPKASIHKRS